MLLGDLGLVPGVVWMLERRRGKRLSWAKEQRGWQAESLRWWRRKMDSDSSWQGLKRLS